MSKSHLETAFANLWRVLASDMPAPVRELQFAPPRRWKFDFAWPAENHRLAVEIEGGIWTKGRHSRGKGITADAEKYNFATLANWRVLRYTTDDLNKRPVQVIQEVRGALERKVA